MTADPVQECCFEYWTIGLGPLRFWLVLNPVMAVAVGVLLALRPPRDPASLLSGLAAVLFLLLSSAYLAWEDRQKLCRFVFTQAAFTVERPSGSIRAVPWESFTHASYGPLSETLRLHHRSPGGPITIHPAVLTHFAVFAEHFTQRTGVAIPDAALRQAGSGIGAV